MRFLPLCWNIRCTGPRWITVSSRRAHTHHATNHKKTCRIISFVTDIEGCASYLDRFVTISRILQHESVTPQFFQDDANRPFFPYTRQIAFQDDESILVVGGDLWDRGGSDLYVIRQLLSLHRRYPDRVHFLMGNRDINKMRIIQEMGGLSGNQPNTPSLATTYLPQHPGVYWLRGTGLKGDPLSTDTIHNNNQDRPAERLSWILSKTMGAPDAFELRKRELGEEMGVDGNKRLLVTDEDVVESYLKSCHPSGEMGQYLSKAKLVLRLGNALFLHGALPIVQSTLSAYEEYKSQETDSLPISIRKAKRKEFWATFFTIATPWTNAPKNQPPDGLQEWVDVLNDFCHSQVRTWSNYINMGHENPNHASLSTWSRDGGYFNENGLDEVGHEKNQTTGYSPHPFGSLMQYGMGWLRDRSKNPTVVYASWLNDGMPRRFMTRKEDDKTITHSDDYARLVSDFFADFSIDVICTGHQPVGDAPFSIQVSKGKFIVCADTSYSGDTHWINHGPTYSHFDSNIDCNSDQVKATHSYSRKNLGRGKSLSGRGDVAVSEVLIEQCEEDRVTNLTTHGVLSDGAEYSTVNFIVEKRTGKSFEYNITPEIIKDSNIGPCDWWVKSIFSDGNMLLSKGSGYSVYNFLHAPNQTPK